MKEAKNALQFIPEAIITEQLRGNETERFIHYPPLVAVITQAGPFNMEEWEVICKSDPEHAKRIAQTILKDMALMVEGARPGGGRAFQQLVLDKETAVDLQFLAELEDRRTQISPAQEYAKVPLMADVSSFLLFGRPAAEIIDEEDREQVMSFGPVIDLGHFQRIMQKDAARDNVVRHWMVNDVAAVLERGVNATFTHRNAEVYQVPEATKQAKMGIVEQDETGRTTALLSERTLPPNVSFLMSVRSADVPEGITLPRSRGRGEIEEAQIENSEQLLRGLSSTFEELLLRYPLEKAMLIFDKYCYERRMGNLGLQIIAAQRIALEDGTQKAKIYSVGEGSAIAFRKEDASVDKTDLASQLKGNLPDNEFREILIKIGMKPDEIPEGELTKSVKGRLIGKGRELAQKTNVAALPIIMKGYGDDALGSAVQAAHLVTEIDIQDGTAVMLLPPSVSENVSLEDIDGQHESVDTLRTSVTAKGVPGRSYSISSYRPPEVQILRKTSWEKEQVEAQTGELLAFVETLTGQYENVFVSMQHSHIHPTLPKWTSLQEEGAQIARFLGDAFAKRGAKVEKRSLVDEHHTDDAMRSYTDFETMLRNEGGEIPTQLIYESSPVMRLLGEATVRLMMKRTGTQIWGDTLVHDTDDKRRIELWDNAVTAGGEIGVGRLACVPFNTGMDFALMTPGKSDRLYKNYLEERFPQSFIAEQVKEHPGMSIDDIVTEFIMKIPDLSARTTLRLRAQGEVDRQSFAELQHMSPDITAYDLFMLDELYGEITRGLEDKKKIPIVVHVLETNYNAQQGKARYVWEQFGLPVPVYRVSFDPSSKRINVLESPPPKQDNLGRELRAPETAEVIAELRRKFGK